MVQYEFEESCGANGNGNDYSYAFGRSISIGDHWTQLAESTLPLTASKLNGANHDQFQASIELRSKQISTKLIVVNLISLLVNLLLAIVGFYFSFTSNSTASSAFAADCVLDLLSSAILLWRYHGDLSSVYMHVREQIACIYLGVLFELSAIGIVIKSISDMTCDTDLINKELSKPSYQLVYLALVATIACTILTVFKCSLYRTLRDKSILLDVINTLISTVFAMSIVMSQALINVNPSFWYLDPILSIILAFFMIGFGIKVIHQNFNVLRPAYYGNSSTINRSYNNRDTALLLSSDMNKNGNLKHIVDYNSNYSTPKGSDSPSWHKTNYSTITFN